ncbi:S8 family peptidase [Sulfitobacter sp. R18_1]|uniref:S8 family peptidase n=1 Tax=Sulfitobacter sp. R18_1 TaxID=2821104 RepID=UPI001ADA6598|nr:S8 family peptidase [Sulfitobacter sp. R18_1]MBO9428035.1 S8 family serine peptidase [Sulfitobacter sp. R18_1]
MRSSYFFKTIFTVILFIQASTAHASETNSSLTLDRIDGYHISDHEYSDQHLAALEPSKEKSRFNISPGTAVTAAFIGAGVAVAFTLTKNIRKEKQRRKFAYDPEFPDHWDNGFTISGDAEYFRTPEYGGFDPSLELVGAASIYARGTQGHGVKVGVLDTGADTDHVDLTGKIDLENSYSYIKGTDSNDFEDRHGHGTHVAGIIAGKKNNQGNHGVAFGSELVIFRGIPTGDEESISSIDYWGDSINRSAAAGVGVINNSWARVKSNGSERLITEYSGRTDFLSSFRSSTIEAFDNAVASDILMVHSAGNDGVDQVASTAGIPVHLPEYQGYFIAAVATDTGRRISEISNRCGVAMEFCMAAPGEEIMSAELNGQWVRKSGTSMAAPMISGAAAVLRSQFPELTAPEISNILFDTAIDLGDAGTDPVYGRGFLNLEEAQSPQGDLMVYLGEDIRAGASSLKDSAIYASTALAPMLVSTLENENLMVGDRYGRGFHVSADALVVAKPAMMTNRKPISRTQLGENLFAISSARGFGIQYDDNNLAYSISKGEVSDSLTSKSDDPLTHLESDYEAEYVFSLGANTSFMAGLSGADQDASFLSTTLGMEAKFDSSSFSAQVGSVTENGSVLGSQFFGAAGNGTRSQTDYLKMSSSFALSQDSSIEVSGTRSLTNFTQKGLITGGKDLSGASGKISLSKENFMGFEGRLTASLASPLLVRSGNISVDMPVARTAAENGISTKSVERTVSSIDVSSPERPYDIGISYESDLGDAHSSLLLHGGYRSTGPEPQAYFRFDLSRRF